MIKPTEYTKIHKNVEKLNSSEIKKIPLSYTDSWNNWIIMNDKLYYYKKFNFNELIGEYLCKYLGLDCVHNELCILEQNNLLLMTESFMDDNHKYERSRYESFNELLKRCNGIENKIGLIDKFSKLCAIDIYMRQADRDSFNNITYKINNNGYRDLTKIYDFTLSFTNMHTYFNVYFKIKLNRNDLNAKTKMLNNLKYYLEKLSKISLMDLISVILDDYKLVMSPKEFMYYEKQESKSLKLIKKIL